MVINFVCGLPETTNPIGFVVLLFVYENWIVYNMYCLDEFKNIDLKTSSLTYSL